MFESFRVWSSTLALALVARRIAATQAALAKVPPDTEKANDYSAELRALNVRKLRLESEIEIGSGRNLDAKVIEAERLTRDKMEKRAAEFETHALKQADTFERQGDHRAASVWRLEASRAFHNVCREFGRAV